MPSVNESSEVKFSLSAREFGLLSRALTGYLKNQEEEDAALEMGLRLMEQYADRLQDRADRMRGAIKKVRDDLAEDPEPEVIALPKGGNPFKDAHGVGLSVRRLEARTP